MLDNVPLLNYNIKEYEADREGKILSWLSRRTGYCWSPEQMSLRS